MHSPHWMQPRFGPWRMSTPVGQTCTHCRQSMQSPAGSPLASSAVALLHRGARLAAIVAIGDVERVLVGERRLDARPRAHVEAHLLAHVAREHVGREGEDADPQIGDERRAQRREIVDQRGRVGEVEHPGAAGPPRDHQPEEMFRGEPRDALRGPPRLLAPHVFAPVALGKALDRLEQVGPHRLRAQIAAPDAARERVHQKQRHRGDDQQAGEVVDLLRPDLDEEEVEARVRQVDQHRLARRVRPAIPAQERREIIDAERDEQHRPFDAAIGAGDALRIDLAARLIERRVFPLVRRRIERRRDRTVFSSTV